MLKLYITESNYVTEAIDDIKKYYPKIPDDVFMQLISLDPTYRGNDSAGKYGKWLLNLYNKGNLSEEEFDEVPDLLNQFTIYRNRIQNKDLNSYKTLDDLSDVLASVVDDDSMLTDRQKVRFLKNVKSGKIKTSAEDDYDTVLDTSKFIVYVPNTHEASMKLGIGTDWCTAHENPKHYNQYTKNNGKLYIIKNKQTGEKWQYSDLKGDFLNKEDNPFNVMDLLLQDEKLCKFFAHLLNMNMEDLKLANYTYKGEMIPEEYKKFITNVTIDTNIEEIPDYTFYECSSLKNVNMSNNIITIGEGAFSCCPYLSRIILSDNLTTIKNLAFYNCKSLGSIIVPNSVKNIGMMVFGDCKNLVIITNNEYVKEYCKKNNIPVKPLNNNESINKNRQYKLHIKET